METLEQLKAIRDNAPDGATHADAERCYVRFSQINRGRYVFVCTCDYIGWVGANSALLSRSLSDINRIIELMEQIETICNEEDEGVEE